MSVFLIADETRTHESLRGLCRRFSCPLHFRDARRFRPATRSNELGHQMMCICGCNQILLECNARGFRSDGNAQRADGIATRGDMTPGRAKASTEYGPTVLVLPPGKGFGPCRFTSFPFGLLVLASGLNCGCDCAWKNFDQRRLRSGPAFHAFAPELEHLFATRGLSLKDETGLLYLAPLCIMLAIASLYYVFYLPGGDFFLGPEKTRAGYLRERKDAV